MHAPYRETSLAPTLKQRVLDPWRLALLFAWVCDGARIAEKMVDRRNVDGELGFATFLGGVTLVVILTSMRGRGRGRAGIESPLQ